MWLVMMLLSIRFVIVVIPIDNMVDHRDQKTNGDQTKVEIDQR
jgi:hypothetical protein